MKIQKTDVLIIGAGPTGLMAACQLALRGVNFKILDKTADHTTQSRALILHARTLEIFEQMGLAETFLKRGQKAKAFNFIANGKKMVRIDASKILESSTLFPEFLILEQAETEKILLNFLKKLGHFVERETELLTLKQNQEGVQVTVRSPSKKYSLQAHYLIGADGASSTVRHQLNIPFAGTTYAKYFFVMDCKTDWQGPTNEIYGAFGKNDFGLFLHMKAKKKIRVIGILPKGLENKKEIEFSDVYPKAIQDLKLDLKLTDPLWISKYHVHHRCVRNFQIGRCFLAGDAAHIHSPVGGQGMNTGLQDAYNLAWKLAMVVSGEAKEKILPTYNQERIRFAHQLVRTTDRVFSFVVSENPLLHWARLHLFPHLMRFLLGGSRKAQWFFKTMSQLGINYRHSPLSQGSGFSKTLRPGDRMPHLKLGKLSIEAILKGNRFHLLVLGSKKQTDLLLQKLQPWKHLLQVHSASHQTLKQALGIQKGYCLIRPDRHVALVSDQMVVSSLENYLNSYFNPHTS